MERFVNKNELLARLKQSKTQVDAVLADLIPAESLQPNIIEWSIKELLAHFIAHEQRALEELRTAQRGQQPNIPIADNDAFNLGAVFLSRAFTIEQLTAAWSRSFWQIIEAVEKLDETNFEPSSQLVQLLEDSIDGALANNTYEHYAEHLLIRSSR